MHTTDSGVLITPLFTSGFIRDLFHCRGPVFAAWKVLIKYDVDGCVMLEGLKSSVIRQQEKESM